MNFVREGNLPRLKTVKLDSTIILPYLKESAKHSNIQVFIYLCNLNPKGFSLSQTIMLQLATIAIKHSQLKNLKYLIRKKNMKLNDDLMNLSAKLGLKLFVIYLRSEGLPITEKTVCKAIEGGYFDLIYFLLNQYEINPKHPDIILTAVKCKDYKTTDYLTTQRKAVSKETFISCFDKFVYLKDYDSMSFLCSIMSNI